MTTQQEIDRQYQLTRLIVGALIAGQLIFAAVAWFLNRSREPAEVPLSDPLVLSWLMVAAGSIFGALYFRRLALGPRDRLPSAQPTSATASTLAALQTKIIVMWALLEGASLIGLVVFFLQGTPQVLYATLAYIAIAAWIFFPRREWFDALRKV